MRGVLVRISLLLPMVFTAAMPRADSRHTLREGETLFSVSREAQVPVEVLIAYNGIADATRVRVGTVLRLPTVYTVKKGDTVYGIARSFAVPVARLFELNRLGPSSRLKAGARIFVPQDSIGTTAVAVQSARPAARNGATVEAVPPPAAVSGPAPAPALAVTGGAAVWPHPGRHEPDHGKVPGLVFYGETGDTVRSATSGEVKWAATYWTRGKVVIIKSPDGNLFTYGGASELLVNVGDRVSAGTDIARLGETPQGGGVKLYFSISDANGHAVSPEKYFSGKSDS